MRANGFKSTGTVVAFAAALSLLVAACDGGGAGSAASAGNVGPASKHSKQHSTSPQAAKPRLTITPGNGSGVDPSKGITVTAKDGTIASVTVKSGGNQVTGTLNAAKTVWQSQWTLNVSQRYTVTATATGTGGKVTSTSAFRTLTPASTFTTEIYEGSGQTYGVGMPVILYFSQPITNKAAVERALRITSSRPVVGAWYWDQPCGMAPACAYFRPREYWPEHTSVSFTGHLNGVQGAPGVYGYHTLTQSFTIGRSLIAVASTKSHRLDLYQSGRLIHRWAISTGRPGDDTPNGTYLTIEKGNPVDMKGPGYNIEVPWSVRFTWSGDYVHDAYWSVGQQGFTNVSHGCVNMSPAAAQTYYEMEVPGDPVTVTGSPRAGTWGNGWTQWFLPWARYVKGSALGMAVQAGPGGSTFVDPHTVQESTATAPTGQPDPGNWTAR